MSMAVSSADKKTLWGNFLSLASLKGFDYILPLITLPYLVRVLGVEHFGVVSFAQSFAQYFILITQYGFTLSATREISLNRDDPKKINEIFLSVMTVKLLLAAACFLILLSTVAVFPLFRDYWMVHLFSFGLVMGDVLIPVWFFQGMERMKFIAYFNISAKLIFTCLVFLLVRGPEDVMLVPLVNGIGFVSVGLVSLYVVNRYFSIRFFVPPVAMVRHLFVDGWNIFMANITPSLYHNSSTFLLGILASNTAVGYYTAGAKLIEVGNAFMYIIARTIYPYMNRNRNAFQTMKKYLLAPGLLMTIAFLLTADIAVKILFTDAFGDTALVLRLLAVSPLTIGVMGAYGSNYLLVHKQDKLYMRIIMYSSVGGLVLLCGGIVFFQHYGAAVTVSITRVVMAALCFAAYRRLKAAETPEAA